MFPKGFFGRSVPQDYDENLPDRSVRILDQRDRLRRQVVIIPEVELRTHSLNQIIFKDKNTIGQPDVAIENWRQIGDDRHYPEIARIIRPGETSRIGVRIIVVKGNELPSHIRDYIDKVNSDLAKLEA